jgi:hypothetical protein
MPKLRFHTSEHTRSLRGALKKYATRIVSTDELREAREKAWYEAAFQAMARQGDDALLDSDELPLARWDEGEWE